MSISYEQLEKWRRRGEDKKSAKTYNLILDLLSQYCNDIIDINCDNVFLQGSYANHTNIKDDSDIDVVVLGKNVFSHNAKDVLNDTLYRQFNEKYEYSNKNIKDFKEQIYQRLNGKPLGKTYIQLRRGSKTLKFNEEGYLWDYVPVDIVPAFEYRNYSGQSGIVKENQVEGIKIYDACKNEYIINYPKLHIKNGIEKNSEYRTNGNYKETIRIFKQLRNRLIELGVIQNELMPSYCLECLLFNVPDTLFRLDLVERVDSIVGWLLIHINKNFVEQNEVYYLFSRSLKIENAKIFIEKCIWLSKTWR